MYLCVFVDFDVCKRVLILVITSTETFKKKLSVLPHYYKIIILLFITKKIAHDFLFKCNLTCYYMYLILNSINFEF